jgi:hypothetical protein
LTKAGTHESSLPIVFEIQLKLSLNLEVKSKNAEDAASDAAPETRHRWVMLCALMC